eukprot:6457582-Amphidinium_carterae.2
MNLLCSFFEYYKLLFKAQDINQACGGVTSYGNCSMTGAAMVGHPPLFFYSPTPQMDAPSAPAESTKPTAFMIELRC